MADPVYVIVPDPDNERGVRMVEHDTGEIVAVGHLEAVSPDFEGGVAAIVQFVGEAY